MALHPGGKCRTTKLQLSKAVQTIQVYLEAQEGVTVEVGATATNLMAIVDGVAELPAAADAVYVRFINTAESYREVYAFGLLA
ncbi:hypothetical protein D3C75_1264200 [compost metagenome]